MISVYIPIRTLSEANMTGEHWSKKHKRHREHRKLIVYAFRPQLPLNITFPIKITLTRIAPRKLDIGDNLPMSLKTIRDQLAELLTGEGKAGRGDGDERLQFDYKQEKGKPKEYGIRIEISPVLSNA